MLLEELAAIDSQIAELRLPRGLSSQVSTLLDQIAVVSAQATSGLSDEERDASLLDGSELSDQLGSIRLALAVEGEAPGIASLLRRQQTVVDQMANLAGRATEVQIGSESLATGIGFVAEPLTSLLGGTTNTIFVALAGAMIGFLSAIGIAFYRVQSRRFLIAMSHKGFWEFPIWPTSRSSPVPPICLSATIPEPRKRSRFGFLPRISTSASGVSTFTQFWLCPGRWGTGIRPFWLMPQWLMRGNGRRVLVIDADFGNQAVTEILIGDVPSRPGFTELIAGQSNKDKVITSIAVSDRAHVDLLSRGRGGCRHRSVL